MSRRFSVEDRERERERGEKRETSVRQVFFVQDPSERRDGSSFSKSSADLYFYFVASQNSLKLYYNTAQTKSNEYRCPGTINARHDDRDVKKSKEREKGQEERGKMKKNSFPPEGNDNHILRKCKKEKRESVRKVARQVKNYPVTFRFP